MRTEHPETENTPHHHWPQPSGGCWHSPNRDVAPQPRPDEARQPANRNTTGTGNMRAKGQRKEDTTRSMAQQRVETHYLLHPHTARDNSLESIPPFFFAWPCLVGAELELIQAGPTESSSGIVPTLGHLTGVGIADQLFACPPTYNHIVTPGPKC
jgi:hypothetical protein